MVKNSDAKISRTFAALSDPTRRQILAALTENGTMTMSDIASPFETSLPAIMKHVEVLRAAGLVRRAKSGRVVTCEATPEPLAEAADWLSHYEKFWTDRLNALTEFVETEPCPSQALPSNAKSKRTRKKSSKPGLNQKR